MDINDPSKDAVSGIIAETTGSNLEFLYQPPFMSSRVFVPSMLDSLLYQVWEFMVESVADCVYKAMEGGREDVITLVQLLLDNGGSNNRW